MVEKIKMIKDTVLEHMEREVGRYGDGRIDTKTAGELADVIKDLAEAERDCWEAEYYRSVTEAMGSSGSSGYAQQARRGYGTIDPAIRDMLAALSPETRAQLRNEL